MRGFPNGSLYFEGLGASDADRIETVARAAGLQVPEDRLVSELQAERRWDLVILDRRSTTIEELDRYSQHGTVVALDEGGEARDSVPYLIDTLPQLPGRSKANIFSPAFQSRPKNRRSPEAPPSGRAMISFGGEDPAALSQTMAAALIDGGFFAASQITLVIGPLFAAQSYPAGIELLRSPPELKELLAGYDVVFTSFGLTAYEAVNAGTSVVLLNPTAYHRALSRIAGFPEAGVGAVDPSALGSLLADPSRLRSECSSIATQSQKSIADHIGELDWSGADSCPVCERRGNQSVGRFVDRSYFRCDHCSVIYELDFAATKRAYTKRYFFEEYREQYGKTYLEDFDNLRNAAAARLARIEAVSSPVANRLLLDVGCAFGPFLVEAAGRGARVFGVDVVHEAAEYVRSHLGFPCAAVSLEELDLRGAFGIESLDIVTMWYVIEHFSRLSEVLRKVNEMLPVGGMFAFSTPNLAGISGRNDLEQFLSASPRDHFTIWDPKISRRVLERFGFRVREVHITGHHPERFPLSRAPEGWRYKLLRRYSEMARLGDTFECYAVKVSELTS